MKSNGLRKYDKEVTPQQLAHAIQVIAADRREAAHYSCDTRVEIDIQARDVVNFMT